MSLIDEASDWRSKLALKSRSLSESCGLLLVPSDLLTECLLYRIVPHHASSCLIMPHHASSCLIMPHPSCPRKLVNGMIGRETNSLELRGAAQRRVRRPSTMRRLHYVWDASA